LQMTSTGISRVSRELRRFSFGSPGADWAELDCVPLGLLNTLVTQSRPSPRNGAVNERAFSIALRTGSIATAKTPEQQNDSRDQPNYVSTPVLRICRMADYTKWFGIAVVRSINKLRSGVCASWSAAMELRRSRHRATSAGSSPASLANHSEAIVFGFRGRLLNSWIWVRA